MSCCAPSRHGQPVEALPAIGQSPTLRRCDAISVKGGRSFVGADKPVIAQDGEGPERAVTLNDYLLEATTVTVERFAAFVAETGYVSEAERFGWSSVFVGGGSSQGQAVGSALGWWHRVDGANWQQPEGPGSTTAGRLDHPVTQVSLADAQAFAQWAGGRLPSEAEWEHAARGGARRRRFPWGDDEPSDEDIYCNIWQGSFPQLNTARDGYAATAPAKSFAPSELGFYNMVGNVWEWTSEPFRIRSVSLKARARNAAALSQNERLLKGGSFLCHHSYCYRYRIAARMALSPDSAASNVGFRVAYDPAPERLR